MKKVRVFVAAHKLAKKYGGDTYRFIHVGSKNAKISIAGAVRDDDGIDNISDKNGIYCELTGLYYIWKNIHDCEYVGLCHYRRYPAKDAVGLVTEWNVLSEKDILNRLENADVILLDRCEKNGEVNGFFADEERLNGYRPYSMMLPVIKKLYPEYTDDFKEEFFTAEMSFGNIMICRKEVFDRYCKWLFDILFAIEENMNQQGGPKPRELGYYSEWLLNVWVRHNKLKVSYANVCFTEQPISVGYVKTYLSVKVRRLLDSIGIH